jgi:hypothetical protein
VKTPGLSSVLVLIPLTALACTPQATGPMNAGPDGSGGPVDGSGQTGDGGAQASANSVGCQGLRSGPFMPVAGIPMYTYTNLGPPLEHRQTYRVTLPEPPKHGHVSFKVPAGGEYVIFTSRALPITVFTWDGVAVMPQSVASSVPDCTEVKSRESYVFAVDTKAHVIRLGGDSAAVVDVLVTQGP